MTRFKVRVAGLRRALGRGLEPYILLPLFALLLLGVIWGTTFHFIALERASAENSAAQSSRELIETYEAQMARNLGAIDQTLKTVKYAVELRGKRPVLPELTEKGLLPSALVFSISITDRQGDIVANNQGRESTPVTGQAYFQIHQAYDSGAPYVGRASRNPKTEEGELQFSRRLNAADGSFGGVVIVTVDPGYFTSGYERSRLGDHGFLGLLGADGVFRAERSGDQVAWGQVVDYAAATRATDRQASALGPDGIRRFTNARPLRGFPLAAVVGLSQDEQLATFHRHQRDYLWQAGAVSALLMAIVAALSRMSWKLTKSQMRIRKMRETYYAASEASLDAFFVLRSVCDANGLITDFVVEDTNRQGEQLTGVPKRVLLGKALCENLPDCRTNRIFDKLVAVAQTGHVNEEEWENQMAAVRAEWLQWQVVRVEGGVVAIVRDISDRRRLEMRIQYQADHDALTGLANRNLLRNRLGQAIAYAARDGHPIWVVFLDLDRFKSVNDSLGHKAGDTLLTVMGNRLKSAMRDTDTVARLGGDEFVLVLPRPEGGGLSTSTMRRVMEVVAQPLMIEGQPFSLSCSIGVAVYPADGVEPDTLLERADIAMYRAKETGRNNFQFFTAAMNERLLERLRIENDLRTAIERDEFVLHYQPQVDLCTGRMVGMEALIRWRHPEIGMVPPGRFIGVAEETGLIVPIGAWVIRTACAQNKAWQRAGLKPMRIAINLSARQFAQPDLVQSITAVLAETGMDAQLLEIELTESMVMADVDQAINILRNLKAIGVLLSIDDFGTGYSSLSYLKRFPIDILKIDQSFVRDIAVDTDDAAIALAIISLAHTLRLKVIAEGVETEAQMRYLRHNGCDVMQGYYFSRPVPAAELELLMLEDKCL